MKTRNAFGEYLYFYYDEYNNEKWSRIGMPALEYRHSDYKRWLFHDMNHRLNGVSYGNINAIFGLDIKINMDKLVI